MAEIRIVGLGKTRGYPYPVCKKKKSEGGTCNQGKNRFLFFSDFSKGKHVSSRIKLFPFRVVAILKEHYKAMGRKLVCLYNMSESPPPPPPPQKKKNYMFHLREASE